jgi:ATP-dependent protease ClpP protease subunit
LLKANPDYRANPNRAVYVQGRIDQLLIDKITPRIIDLQTQSRDPISVYIDSQGGSTASGDSIYRLLKASDQDCSSSCRLITVATGRAASAAAILLCSGSYAIAYPESVIFFHGVSRLADSPITATDASDIMELLRQSNDRYALALADRSLSRFGFRYVSQRPKFQEYRQKINKPNYSDLFCFVGIIQQHLSREAIGVAERAIDRNQRYNELVQYVGQRVFKKKGFQIQSVRLSTRRRSSRRLWSTNFRETKTRDGYSAKADSDNSTLISSSCESIWSCQEICVNGFSFSSLSMSFIRCRIVRSVG